MGDFSTSEKNEYKFEEEEESYIKKLCNSVKEKADYDLRRVIGLTERFKKKVATGNTDEYGESIENWEQVSTKDLINFFAEGAAWSYYSTPIRMQAFIESSLGDVVYKYEFNTILKNLTEGTVAQKTATAELQAQESNFAALYRKLYTDYVTEVLKSFDGYLRRVERIINFRQTEERMTAGTVAANKNPF